jgi:hypothetical protein
VSRVRGTFGRSQEPIGGAERAARWRARGHAGVGWRLTSADGGRVAKVLRSRGVRSGPTPRANRRPAGAGRPLEVTLEVVGASPPLVSAVPRACAPARCERKHGPSRADHRTAAAVRAGQPGARAHGPPRGARRRAAGQSGSAGQRGRPMCQRRSRSRYNRRRQGVSRRAGRVREAAQAGVKWAVQAWRTRARRRFRSRRARRGRAGRAAVAAARSLGRWGNAGLTPRRRERARRRRRRAP